MEIWKTLAAPVIASIIGGIIVGLVLGRINSPETPVVEARAQWLDISNPLSSRDTKSISEIDKAIQSIWGVGDSSLLLANIRFHERIRLIRLELRNVSNLRSKPIEVAVEEKGGLFSANKEGSLNATASRLTIAAINPGETAMAFAVMGVFTSFLPPSIQILHDGKRIEVVPQSLPDELSGLIGLIYSFPLLTLIAGVLMAMATLFLLIVIPIALISELSPEFKANYTSRKELAKMLKFIEYMRARHPDKMPEEVGS
jgi:hypothetical protein